jgi:hypothetical protein
MKKMFVVTSYVFLTNHCEAIAPQQNFIQNIKKSYVQKLKRGKKGRKNPT